MKRYSKTLVLSFLVVCSSVWLYDGYSSGLKQLNVQLDNLEDKKSQFDIQKVKIVDAETKRKLNLNNIDMQYIPQYKYDFVQYIKANTSSNELRVLIEDISSGDRINIYDYDANFTELIQEYESIKVLNEKERLIKLIE